MVVEIRKPFIAEDRSKENLIKDSEGRVIGYKRSQYILQVPIKFIMIQGNIEKLWTPWNYQIAEILNQICICEDNKYPTGLGRNMFFNAYIYPLFKEYLKKNGFNPNFNEISFCENQAIKTHKDYLKFKQEVENGRRK